MDSRDPSTDLGTRLPGEAAADVSARDQLAANYPAVPESVAIARAAVVEFAARSGASPSTLVSVALAVSEAATNVVLHAYSDAAEPGAIEITAAEAGGELWVIVADTGSGLRPRRDSAGLGLGLGLIAQVSDGIDLVPRADRGLELRMRFSLAQA
jgi:serine/threonine-protein kinase RsbW